MDPKAYDLEIRVLKSLKGRFVNTTDMDRRKDLISNVIKTISYYPDINIDNIIKDIYDLSPISDLVNSDSIEDIIINNTANIFVYDGGSGFRKMDIRIETFEDLELLVHKLRLYATNESANGNIMDVHLPDGSRVNIISSPLGYDITIRKFKRRALSILDLINFNELDYQIAARLWMYVDVFRVRPANILIGGLPAAGKTTLLNAMFSFFRPVERIITIEETYELDTTTQPNCAKLETSQDMPMLELVKNSLRMRPDIIVVGEVRGEEAKDMITAMNIGKIVLGTIHSSTARDVINRLQNEPMNVPKELVPVIDVIVMLGQVYIDKKPLRKVTQISEIAGIETQVLLSDLYKYDYKTHKSAPILPSVTYRDTISTILGIAPSDIIAEEKVRAHMLYAMNRLGKRDITDINGLVRDYYQDPSGTLKKLGLNDIEPVIKI